MEFVISPTLCQLRYSFQTWILQFHLSRGSDSNRDCFRIREVSSNLLDDLSIFSKITFNSAFMIFSRLTLQAISTTNVESSGPGWTRTSSVSNVTILQTVEITNYSYWPKLWCIFLVYQIFICIKTLPIFIWFRS